MSSLHNSMTLTSEQIAAARFLARATMGADLSMIDTLVAGGNDFDAWLDAQKLVAATPTKTWMVNLHHLTHGEYVTTNDDPDYPTIDDDTGWVDILRRLPDDQVPSGYNPATQWYKLYLNHNAPFIYRPLGQPYSPNFTSPWMQNIVFDSDYLRQRVAWALSQIFVVSYAVSLNNSGVAIADYWDTLTTHALGNFYDLLLAISTHKAMAYYLSSLGNQKYDGVTNRTPDENFAREVMQLFTIGLWELNDDSSQKTDGGNPIPTYDNATITAMARVFTGLWFETLTFNSYDGHRLEGSMRQFDLAMFEAYHDIDEKVLFPGTSHEVTLPANQAGMDDIEAALTVLFNHPNTPPFICKQLIGMLVSANPSADYVTRVVNVFKDNGSGVRGDLHAVVKAILLDTEATTVNDSSLVNGKQIEPVIRVTRIVKAFKGGNAINSADRDSLQFWRGQTTHQDFGQWILSSPSVFNYFRPDYQHLGTSLGNNGLTSPVFGIINDVAVPELANYLQQIIFDKIHFEEQQNLAELLSLVGGTAPPDFVLDLADEIALADDTAALVDRLDLLLCYGHMSSATRAVIERAITEYYTDDTDAHREMRVKTAIYITALSPDAAILR